MMPFYSSLIFFCFFVLNSVAHAYSSTPYFPSKESECGEINLQERANPSLKSYYSQPNAQGGVNWCYAYSAADLLSWELQQPVSATYLAIKSNDNLNIFSKLFRKMGKFLFGMNSIVPEFGDTASAVKLGLKNGVCSESVMPSNDPNILNVNAEVASIYQRKERLQTSELFCSEHKKLFPTKDIKEIFDVIDDARFQDVQEKLNRLADSACIGKLIKPDGYRQVNYLNASDIDVVESINQHFSSQSASPISLMISPQAIENPNKMNGSLMAHVVTIMGRKFDPTTNKCRFLIRDSNGASACESYAKSNDCKNGNYWISDEAIHRGAWSIAYITK